MAKKSVTEKGKTIFLWSTLVRINTDHQHLGKKWHSYDKHHLVWRFAIVSIFNQYTAFNPVKNKIVQIQNLTIVIFLEIVYNRWMISLHISPTVESTLGNSYFCLAYSNRNHLKCIKKGNILVQLNPKRNKTKLNCK